MNKKYWLFLILFFPLDVVYTQELGEESYGIASFYSNQFYGRKTANQELLKRNTFTAAHRIYPFNTLLEVTNIDNKKTVIVRVNDRGPYVRGRIIDLTESAANQINLKNAGLAKVKIKVIGFDNEIMLIPYHDLELETSPKFSSKFYQKTRLKYRKKYKVKKNIRSKKYVKKKVK